MLKSIMFPLILGVVGTLFLLLTGVAAQNRYPLTAKERGIIIDHFFDQFDFNVMLEDALDFPLSTEDKMLAALGIMGQKPFYPPFALLYVQNAVRSRFKQPGISETIFPHIFAHLNEANAEPQFVAVLRAIPYAGPVLRHQMETLVRFGSPYLVSQWKAAQTGDDQIIRQPPVAERLHWIERLLPTTTCYENDTTQHVMCSVANEALFAVSKGSIAHFAAPLGQPRPFVTIPRVDSPDPIRIPVPEAYRQSQEVFQDWTFSLKLADPLRRQAVLDEATSMYHQLPRSAVDWTDDLKSTVRTVLADMDVIAEAKRLEMGKKAYEMTFESAIANGTSFRFHVPDVYGVVRDPEDPRAAILISENAYHDTVAIDNEALVKECAEPLERLAYLHEVRMFDGELPWIRYLDLEKLRWHSQTRTLWVPDFDHTSITTPSSSTELQKIGETARMLLQQDEADMTDNLFGRPYNSEDAIAMQAYLAEFATPSAITSASPRGVRLAELVAEVLKVRGAELSPSADLSTALRSLLSAYELLEEGRLASASINNHLTAILAITSPERTYEVYGMMDSLDQAAVQLNSATYHHEQAASSALPGFEEWKARATEMDLSSARTIRTDRESVAVGKRRLTAGITASLAMALTVGAVGFSNAFQKKRKGGAFVITQNATDFASNATLSQVEVVIPSGRNLSVTAQASTPVGTSDVASPTSLFRRLRSHAVLSQ